MRPGRLRTHAAHGPDDVAAHFDAVAPHYAEAHGHADRLLAYRLDVIRSLIAGAPRGTLLEIGCGTAVHLVRLAAEFTQAIGTDLSPEMVRVAQANVEGSPARDRISIRVDPAEELGTIRDGSVAVALCIGALEHMVDQRAVLHRVRSKLAGGGVLVVLTPNGGSVWYRHLAPLLGCDTRHLSTDRFLTASELDSLLADAELTVAARRAWRFVPQGDLPRGWAGPLRALDGVGALARWGYLRGGLAVAARASRPASPPAVAASP